MAVKANKSILNEGEALCLPNIIFINQIMGLIAYKVLV